MSDPVPRDKYPWWVRLSIWGLPNRAAVWGFVWLSAALALGSVVYALIAGNPVMFVGLAFVVAALLYWLAIRWVDRHGSWDPKSP
jgi:hypothetical protein